MSERRQPGTQRGIHLVQGTGKARAHGNTRLTLGNFIADVLISKTDTISCYYALQRVGSAEVVELGRFETFEEAKSAAQEALERWHSRDQRKIG